MKRAQFTLNMFMLIFCLMFLITKSIAQPQNVSLLKTSLRSYHDSGEYLNELSKVIQQADKYLIAQITNNARAVHPKKLAIVFDIDETSLSNYRRMEARDFASMKNFILEDYKQGKAMVIKPTHALYTHALENNVAVFFITGRTPDLINTTTLNLKNAGYTQWNGLYFRSKKDHRPSNAPFKTETRASIEKQGYTIIASVGDQQSDLIGGHAIRTFQLPNPYYYVP